MAEEKNLGKKAQSLADFAGKRCAVLGIGISNVPLIRLLASAGAILSAYDEKDVAYVGGETVTELSSLGCRVFTGVKFSDLVLPEDVDFVFRSPGIRPDVPCLARAVANGAVLTSEMAEFLSRTPSSLLLVTGSDGKTTTTTLTHLFCEADRKKSGIGRAYVGGNIGSPLLPALGQMTENDVSVLELSSFQLTGFAPVSRRAAVTNVSPNHLNWHVDMAEYVAAKENILVHAGVAVLNAENAETLRMACDRVRAGKPVCLFSSVRHEPTEFPLSGELVSCVYVADGKVTVCDGKDKTSRPLFDESVILLPGRHNLENVLTAVGLTYGTVDPSVYAEVLSSFRGVKHRLEWVADVNGVSYYNSSIDSSPTRTAAALSALPGDLTVLCGGYDKHIPYAPLGVSLVARRPRRVILSGATASAIEKAIREAPGYTDSLFPIFRADSLGDAIRMAHDLARPGEKVLLSPASASFDAFRNFEERGEFFRSVVLSFPKGDNP